MDEGEEMDGAMIETCGEASEMLELVATAFDAVAGLVADGVVRDRHFSALCGTAGRDDGKHVCVGDDPAQVVAVVCFVSDDGAALHAIEQRRGSDDVIRPPAGEDDAQWPAEAFFVTPERGLLDRRAPAPKPKPG
jgi:hypothetical protein